MDRRERFEDVDEALLAALDGWQSHLWTAMPARVQSFNADKMTVEAQPMLMAKVRQPDGTLKDVTMPLLVDVPVVFMNGGGFVLTYPIKPGDDALIIFASRCIDGWWSLAQAAPQIDFRMHDLSDGFAIIGPRAVPNVVPNINLSAVQLRTQDGQTYVEVSSGKIHLVADEVMIHGRLKTTFDAGGTGFVYTPDKIDTYTDDVPSDHHRPHPPEVPV